MARFIVEMDHPSGTNLHTNWANNDSSSDNSSVYKYGQTDGLSVQTGYLDNSSSSTNYPDSLSGRMSRLFARIYTQTNCQTNLIIAACLISMQVRPRRMIQSGHYRADFNRFTKMSLAWKEYNIFHKYGNCFNPQTYRYTMSEEQKKPEDLWNIPLRRLPQT